MHRIRSLSTAALAASLVLTVPACAARGSVGDPTVGVGYFQSSTIGPEVLVSGNPDLAAQVDGPIELTPIDSGVSGLAQLRGGAFPFVSGVGNPPVVGAIASDTKLKVIYAEYLDAAALIVPSTLTDNNQLAGRTIGDLQGSSEDFEIRGWLDEQGLTDQVTVVGFPSEAAVAAAYKATRIDAAYTEIAQAQDLVQHHDARVVVTAEQIAELGYPSLNVLAVTDEYAAQHPRVVQQFVCQIMRAQAISTGKSADSYIATAAATVGAPADQAIGATKGLPFVPAPEQLSWFREGSGELAEGKIARAYALTGQFLVDQGRTESAPTAEEIAGHLDSSYVEQALRDGCDQ